MKSESEQLAGLKSDIVFHLNDLRGQRKKFAGKKKILYSVDTIEALLLDILARNGGI